MLATVGGSVKRRERGEEEVVARGAIRTYAPAVTETTAACMPYCICGFYRIRQGFLERKRDARG